MLTLIYIAVLGPIFALFRWRFRRAIRFIPVLIFFMFAVYLTLGATYKGAKKMISGVEQDQDLMDSLNIAYIICTFILSQSDFRIVFFGIFPVYQAS